MQINYFREKYYEEYGSVYFRASSTIMNVAEDMDWYKIMTPDEVLNNMVDFKDNEDYQYFVECLQHSDTVIVYGRDGVRPGDTVNIYQMIMEV